MRHAIVVALLALTPACGGHAAGPAALLSGTNCSHCRMIVSDPRLAGQVMAPGEEPRFFDDIGCLAAYLRQHPLDDAAVAYVTDHGTGAWVRADAAVYSRSDAIATPMGSHLVAYASEAARVSDPSVPHAAFLTAADVFDGDATGGHK